MVSTFATGYAADANGRPFKRRNYIPAIIIVCVLALTAVVAWTWAAAGGDDVSYPTDCAMPPTIQEPPFEVASQGEMLKVAPAAQSTFKVSVLNAGAARGEARSVSEDLVALGFTAADPAFGDDAAYGDTDLNCVGQIRFGPGSQGAATAVWLALPCAQLINDGRGGNTIDIALGKYFHGLNSTQDVQAALESLRAVDPRNPKSGVDRSLIEAVHSQSC